MILCAIGAVVYVEGHGMHLAANWINNESPSRIAHLWDEDIGHHVWYTGFALIVAALAAVYARHPPRPGAVGYGLALAVGATHVTNAIAGGTLVMALATATAFTAWGAATRAGAGRLLVAAYAPAPAALLVTLI